tara:strand:- start:63 stop:503 length:441 start_codon:yes stop_codon:yes gene_type:complete
MSLRTKSSIKALHVSQSITSKLNDYWLKLRLSEMDIPAGHLLVANAEGSNTGVLTISEARDLYVKLKSAGRSKSFSAAAQRYCSYVIKCLGDRSLDQLNMGLFYAWAFIFWSIFECCLGFSCIEGIDWDMLPKSCTPLGKVSALSA